MATKKNYFIPFSFRCCWLRDSRPVKEKIRIRDPGKTSRIRNTVWNILLTPPNPLLNFPDLVLPFKCQDPYRYGISVKSFVNIS
jgi:hypothetical protein